MDIAAEEAPGDFAVVSHGGILAMFMHSVTGIWTKPDYAQRIALRWDNGVFIP